MKAAVIALLLVGTTAWAQVHKCQSADGKVVYSDAPCAGAGKASVIDARPNSLDTTGQRQAGAAAQARADRAALLANPPAQCRFKAFRYGDKHGATLRDAATAECVENLVSGQSPSTTAYQAWKDHFDRVSSGRQAAVAQNQANANTQRIIDENASQTRRLGNQIEDKRYTCKRNSISTDLVCK